MLGQVIQHSFRRIGPLRKSVVQQPIKLLARGSHQPVVAFGHIAKKLAWLRLNHAVRRDQSQCDHFIRVTRSISRRYKSAHGVPDKVYTLQTKRSQKLMQPFYLGWISIRRAVYPGACAPARLVRRDYAVTLRQWLGEPVPTVGRRAKSMKQ